jgi:hypothetical protein
MIERSHGKARPTLPRSAELSVVEADPERAGNRLEGGRFAPGNVVGRGRGWKRAVTKMIGREVDDPIASAVAHDAWRLFAAGIREMPSDGPTVRSLMAQKCRHDALAGFWTAHAVAAGLATPAGIEAQRQATLHGQRAERLAVTALDIATKLAEARRLAAPAAHRAPWLEYAADPEATPAQDGPSGDGASTDPSESADASEGIVGQPGVEPSGEEGAP